MAIVVSLLGPLVVLADGEPVDLGPPQQRILLALLALHVGTPVDLTAIERALWEETPPPTATKVVQTYVSRLRKRLGADAIRFVGHGYTLDPEVSVDVQRFRRLTAEARHGDALAIWRGDALADVPALAAEARELESLRVAALEEHFDAELERGQGPALVPALESVVAEHPTRERLLAQLVLALYRSGRQTDALAAYRSGRERLVDDYGLEPGATLRELERRILRQDPDLLPGRAADAPPTLRRRRRTTRIVVVAAIVVLAAASGMSAIALDRGKSPPPVIPIRANMLLKLDPKTNRILASIPVARGAAAVDVSGNFLWIASERERTVSRVDTRTERITTIGEPHPVTFLTHDDRGNVYASGFDFPFIWQINPRTVQIVRSFRVRTRALGLSIGGGSLWAVDRFANAVARVDLAQRRVAQTIKVGINPVASTFGYGSLWVANGDSGTVAVIRPGAPTPILVPRIPSPFGISAGAGGVWVASNGTHAVFRIDPDTHAVVARIALGTPTDFLTNVSAGPHGVWAISDHHVVRIDPATDRVAARIRFPRGTEPKAVAATADFVWITVSDPKDDM